MVANSPDRPTNQRFTTSALDRVIYPDILPAIAVIASQLNIHTFQGIVEQNGAYILPNMDGQLLKVSSDGSTSVLVEFCQGFECGNFGVPYGIINHQDAYILTVSAFGYGGRLIAVQPNGAIATIADFSTLLPEGGPFGLIEANGDYIVTVSQNVNTSNGALVQIKADGAIATIADLSEFGIPFAVTAFDGGFVVAQEKGHLVKVGVDGTVSSMVNLGWAKQGVPLALVADQEQLAVITNRGALLSINSDGQMTHLVNVSEQGYGTPSALLKSGDRWIITTNAGYLLGVEAIS
jgi:hypothetical protein